MYPDSVNTGAVVVPVLFSPMLGFVSLSKVMSPNRTSVDAWSMNPSVAWLKTQAVSVPTYPRFGVVSVVTPMGVGPVGDGKLSYRNWPIASAGKSPFVQSPLGSFGQSPGAGTP